MKKYKILLLAVVAALATGCYSDDSNLDYKTLDLPVIDNPTNDLALFVPNRAYKIKLTEHLRITPNVVYKDMNDLSYKWVIDGKVITTTKDLDWVCDMETERVSCYFEIRRNSAGNSTIFSFTVELEQPYQKGYSVLVETVEGELRYDVISYTEPLTNPYTFVYHKDGARIPLLFTGDNPRLKEYWSCETSSIVGNVMFLDDDPNNCASFNGLSLLKEMTLAQEFKDEELPADFRLKDFMHGGFVSYVLADDGRIFQRKGSRIYYTGRFLNLPMQYNGKQINGKKFIGTRYSENSGGNYGLIYEETDKGGRFLLVNFDYSTASDATGKKAGQLTEFPEGSNMNGITDYELIDGWHIRNTNFGYNGGQSSVMMLFRKKSDGKYYTREVSIKFTASTAGIDISEVYAEVYRELPDFGPDSKICVIRVDGYGNVMYAPQGYIYYTAASNPRKVLGRERTSKDAPVEFHTFDSEVIAIDHETYSRTSGYMAFALGDGTVMIYTTRRSGLDPTTNLDTFEEERVVSTFDVDGKIRWMGCKYGGVSSY